MCACMPVCFQRNLVTFTKAHPTQMIFITTSSYRKYVVYWVTMPCWCMRLGVVHCASAKRMRIHDNILRTRCVKVIVYITTKKVSGPSRGQGSQVHHITKIRIWYQKSLTNRNNQDSAITYFILSFKLPMQYYITANDYAAANNKSLFSV